MDPRDIARRDWTAARDASIAVAQAWHRSPEQRILADLFDDAAAASLPVARDRALTLLADTGWAARLLAPLVAALAADPLFEPPLRISRGRGRTSALLYDAPAARVTATVTPARTLAADQRTSVVVPGQVAVVRYVRAGAAHLRRWRVADGIAQEIIPLFLRDGDVAVHDGRSEGHVIAAATGDVVTLTVLLRAEAVSTVREFALADGALIRTAGTDDAASRTAMLLTLLRLTGRADAPEVFDAATRDPAPHARWGAMREWLALDAAAAFPRLGEMADDPDAEVRDAAEATIALVARRRAECRD